MLCYLALQSYLLDYTLALQAVTGGKESRTMHEEGDIDKGNVSGEQEEVLIVCPATGPVGGRPPPPTSVDNHIPIQRSINSMKTQECGDRPAGHHWRLSGQ